MPRRAFAGLAVCLAATAQAGGVLQPRSLRLGNELPAPQNAGAAFLEQGAEKKFSIYSYEREDYKTEVQDPYPKVELQSLTDPNGGHGTGDNYNMMKYGHNGVSGLEELRLDDTLPVFFQSSQTAAASVLWAK
jgi:hypothetical protein